MELIQQEISYLRGFLAGDQTIGDQHHQVYDRLLTVIEDLSEELRQHRLRLTELEEYVEVVDEDLDDVEQILFEDAELVEMTCPACEEEILIDQEDLEDPSMELLCPNCQMTLTHHDANRHTNKELEIQQAR